MDASPRPGGSGPARRLVLASGSPTRLRVLRAAGLDPEVVVSGVDEDAVLAGAPGLSPSDAAGALARAKAETVAAGLADSPAGARPLVLGCDSLLDVDGDAQGKPGSAAVARDRWRRLRGRSAVLVTGHHLLDAATGRAGGEVAATTVRFGCPTDAEIDAYVATGEPLAVAGGFTLDGRAAAFVDGVDGDPNNVLGVSVALLRRLLGRLDVEITALWR